MSYINNINCVRTAMTLAEMLIAMAIMAVVFAVVLPQFQAVRNSWNSKAGAAETLQNGRVLTEHMYRNLSTAVKITAVSDSSETNGYIVLEDNDGFNFRYDVNSTSNYVEFGQTGKLSDLAGPVSQLQFTCYDANDFETPITDGNSIRLVSAEITFTNSDQSGRDKTFTTSTYLRTNWDSASESSDPNLVGWWKLDETSGLTAVDSSGNGNHGFLENMSGDEWTNGVIDGALEFDGINDYVDTDYRTNLPVWTICVWVTSPAAPTTGTAETQGGPIHRENNYQINWNHDNESCQGSVALKAGLRHYASYGALEANKWYHLAATYDGETLNAYKDGVLITSNTTPSGSPAAENNSLKFGRHAILARYFTGIIDDIRIYNRALDPTEIAQLADVLRYREFTETKTSSDVTSITISTPDTNEGDLLIAAIATDGDTSSSIAPPGGEGWTATYTGDYSNDVTLGAWWKLADASESSSHQFTWTGDERAYAWMMRFTGHKASNPINDYSVSGESSSTPTSPEVTTTLENCLILRLGAFDDDDITVDDPGLSGHIAITMDKSSSILLQDSYETDFDKWTDNGATDWDRTTAQKHSGSYSAYCGSNDTYLTSDNMYTSGYSTICIEFWYMDHRIDDSDNVFLDLYNGSSYVNKFELGNTSPEQTWHKYEETINNAGGDTQYFRTDFHIRFDGAGIDGGEALWIDDVTVTVTSAGMVSGGAGYIMQSTSGDSGTSNFLLGSSNEAKTLTIAIAPENESGGGGGGGGGINP